MLRLLSLVVVSSLLPVHGMDDKVPETSVAQTTNLDKARVLAEQSTAWLTKANLDKARVLAEQTTNLGKARVLAEQSTAWLTKAGQRRRRRPETSVAQTTNLDKAIVLAEQSTAWLAKYPYASIAPTYMQNVPKFGKCIGTVLRITKLLTQAHNSGEVLNIPKLEEIATEASKDIKTLENHGCDDECKLAMYKDAIAQRAELWRSVGMILDHNADPLPTTEVSENIEFFKYGLREWVFMEGEETRAAAFKSSCTCEGAWTNLYCRSRGVDTPGWPETLFEMDAKLQAVLVGIEQDQRVSQKHPDQMKHGQYNFLLKWKTDAREIYVREAIGKGVKRRAAGVLEKLQDFLASDQGKALQAAYALAKAYAATTAVGGFAACGLLKKGHDFAKAMLDLALARAIRS